MDGDNLHAVIHYMKSGAAADAEGLIIQISHVIRGYTEYWW